MIDDWIDKLTKERDFYHKKAIHFQTLLIKIQGLLSDHQFRKLTFSGPTLRLMIDLLEILDEATAALEERLER